MQPQTTAQIQSGAALLSIISAISTVVFGLAAAALAALQWRVNDRQRIIAREKLKHDLFDRRYEVYESLIRATMAAYFAAITEDKAELLTRVRKTEDVLLAATCQTGKAAFIFHGEAIDEQARAALSAAEELQLKAIARLENYSRLGSDSSIDQEIDALSIRCFNELHQLRALILPSMKLQDNPGEQPQ